MYIFPFPVLLAIWSHEVSSNNISALIYSCYAHMQALDKSAHKRFRLHKLPITFWDDQVPVAKQMRDSRFTPEDISPVHILFWLGGLRHADPRKIVLGHNKYIIIMWSFSNLISTDKLDYDN